MGIFRYYGLVVRTAWSHSLSVAQDILFGVFIVGGALLYLLRSAGMIADISAWMNQLTGWQIAVTVLGAIVVIRLILAPYWLYEEKREALKRLSQTSPLEIAYDAKETISKGNATVIRYSIGIHNHATDRSIRDVCLRAETSLFTVNVIAEAIFGLHEWEKKRPELRRIDELHPGVTEYVELFGLPTADLTDPANEVLGRKQTFELELMGRDVPAVRATFEYNPAAPIKIRMIT